MDKNLIQIAEVFAFIPEDRIAEQYISYCIEQIKLVKNSEVNRKDAVRAMLAVGLLNNLRQDSNILQIILLLAGLSWRCRW